MSDILTQLQESMDLVRSLNLTSSTFPFPYLLPH